MAGNKSEYTAECEMNVGQVDVLTFTLLTDGTVEVEVWFLRRITL